MPHPSAITPFWLRLPAFFSFPLQPRNLIQLLAYAAGWLLAGVLPSLLGVVLMVGLVIGFIRYCFNVLEYTAYGYLKASDYPDHKLSTPGTLYKLIAALVIQGVTLAFLLHSLGPAGRIISSVVSSLIAPATIMVVVMTNSLVAGLHPLQLMAMMLRIGSPYLLLNVFLFLLQISSGIAVVYAATWLPKSVALPALAIAVMFFLLMMFQMMGYVLYQKHEELGLSTMVSTSTPESLHADALAALDERIQQFLDEDKMAAAIDWLQDAVREKPDDMARHERYHRLLMLAADKRALKHADDYLQRLHAIRQTMALIKLLEDCWRLDPEWLPSASLRMPLAQLCVERRRIKDALRLLKDFHKHHPTAPEIPDAWLLQARILIERYSRDTQALPFLKAIKSRYPHHAASGEADKLMRLISDLGLNART